MSSADAKLVIRGLKKTYGSVVALDETNLVLPEGEFLTLLGPSGSGKTTLLRLIAGLTLPDSGTILIDGVDATYEPPHRRDLGIVFQNYALFPHMTVLENIAFPLQMRKIPEREIHKLVTQVLETVRLPNVETRFPHELSGGQQQRIALARCLVYKPSIVLMDEPLGALDKKLRDQIQLEIKRLHHDLGITMLYVTHDQEEALVMSDRICLMNAGEIVQSGSPSDLYFNPRSIFAASFLGESNLLPVVTRGSENGQLILTGPAEISIRAVALDIDTVPVGTTLTLMIRPECVTVSNQPSDNALKATVENVILLGQITKVYGRLTDNTLLIASSLTRSAADLQAGNPAWFSFNPAHATILRS